MVYKYISYPQSPLLCPKISTPKLWLQSLTAFANTFEKLIFFCNYFRVYRPTPSGLHQSETKKLPVHNGLEAFSMQCGLPKSLSESLFGRSYRHFQHCAQPGIFFFHAGILLAGFQQLRRPGDDEARSLAVVPFHFLVGN